LKELTRSIKLEYLQLGAPPVTDAAVAALQKALPETGLLADYHRTCISGRFLGLEQLDRIAERIVENDLRATRPGNDVVPELESGATEALDFRGQIFHLNMNTVPTAGDRFATIGHRLAA